MEMNYDEATLRQLEEELDTKIYPGTEIMADVGSHHFVKGASAVLVPQPSADPHDPLNWSPFWKMTVAVLTTAVSFMQGFVPLALAPMFPALMEEFDASLPDVIEFTGITILVLGFSNFLWVPIQTAFGRRPVLIFSTIICFGSTIWRAKAQSYSSFLGACALNGIGAGPAETAQPQITADVFFLHERGFWNTLYFTFYFGSLMVGPIVSGPMTYHIGFRSFFWLNVGLYAALIIALIFLFPETKWHRIHPSEMLNELTGGSASEKGTTNLAQVNTAENVLSKAATQERDPFLGKGKPSKQQFRIYQPNANPLRSIIYDVWIPIKMHIFPIVELAAFVVSWSASCFLTINLTQSQVFAGAPYNFDAQTIGFFNFAILIGAIIGLFTNGFLSDWISMRSTKRNRGIREPEMRLPALLPYVLIMLLGNFVVAFGYQYKWPWEAIVIIGFTCAGIQVAAIPAIVSTYAVDSYKPVAGSIFVTITVNKNLWGYGFSKFISPWVEESGFLPPIMTNMCLTFLFCACSLLFMKWGKKMRGLSAKDSLHQL